ncbi:hypothetical protein BCR42DRAFT_456690 [Absidia repens]|uniref:CAP-Gly domain-containing protein n=1 Tax=Absidia repens TaxID=90262 RepID=A0A1X2HZH5_9FUNG|nr:hypothetical protein BCR42DRAFT_456690 [Absidia repens]
MLVNNSTRIGRLPVGGGETFDIHHHHRLISAHSTTTTSSSSSSSASSSTASKAITNTSDLFSPTLQKRQHRSCRSSCHSSSSSTSTSSSSSQVANNTHGLKLGQKVTVSSMNALGTIRFIGTTSFKPGIWVGIELDIIGTGKNSGVIKGVRYFDCPPETGLFIIANRVTSLKQSTSTSADPQPMPTVTPKKSLTTTTTTAQRRRAKTPLMDSSSPTTKTTSHHPRQRCLSHDHHPKPTSTVSMAPKKKLPPASLSTKTSRPQSRTEISSTGQKPLTSPSSLMCNKTALPTTRKSVTPVISSPSTLSNIKQQQSKSTRRTVTPTTNSTKKRNSSLTSSTTTKHLVHGPDTPRKSKSTSTRQVVTQDELKKMHVLLEQSRQEKQRLSDEMNGKEAVWERLVTAKESYALKVQDMQKEITRLQDSLHHTQQHVTQLELQLSQSKQSSTSGSLSGSSHGDLSSGGIYGINTVEQQYIQRIEKLDRLVREWQQDAQDSHQRAQQQQQTYTAQIEQLRRDLAERDQATATMEQEYEASKQANSETIRQYEATMIQWTTERDEAMASKDNHIALLGRMIDELKACHFLLPPSPKNEEDGEDGDVDGLFMTGNGGGASGITDMNDGIPCDSTNIAATTIHLTGKNNTTNSSNIIHSSRRRLEKQLELSTVALEDVQQKHKTMALENEQLREQLSHMHAASGAANQQFQQLQKELSLEINDKRIVMEERDLALQYQLRTEDKYKDLVMTNTRLEQQLEQRQATQEKILAVENKLIQLQQQHSLLLQQTHDAAIEQQGEHYTDKVRNVDGQHDMRQLQQTLASMSLAMETKTLRIAELENDLQQMEHRTTHHHHSLEQQQRQRPYGSTTAVALTSPMCSGIIMPSSPISETTSSVITLPSRVNSRSDHNDSNNRSSFSFGDISLMAAMNKGRMDDQNSKTYCVNCDIFDTHITAACPNQDETY